MRFDLNAERASFYNLRIVPNHNDQDPAWGLMDAKFKDGKDAFLRLMSNDRYIIELKKIPGALLYIGKLCMRTFVVDLVTLSYIDKRRLSQPTIHRVSIVLLFIELHILLFTMRLVVHMPWQIVTISSLK